MGIFNQTKQLIENGNIIFFFVEVHHFQLSIIEKKYINTFTIIISGDDRL